jgi:hypothetical protein
MKDTGFNPPPTLRNRIAPTQHQEGTRGKILLGEVHDPTAHRMGGVAGHAGLFSTADDLAIFAQTLLDGGTRRGVSILNQQNLEKITTPQSPAGKVALRGLGWDIDSPFSSNREKLYPVGSFGHTGFTGTSIWIDPVSKTYVILLTNRVHPNGNGKVKQLRSQIASVVASALGPVSAEQVLSAHPALKESHERMGRFSMTETDFRDGKVYPVRNSCGTLNSAEQRGIISKGVKAGIEVLNDEKFASLSGLRVGLITNHSGMDSEGRRTIDLLYKAPGVKLSSIFVQARLTEKWKEGSRFPRIPRQVCLSTACTEIRIGQRQRCLTDWMQSSLIFRMWGFASTLTSPRWPMRWKLRPRKGSLFTSSTGLTL